MKRHTSSHQWEYLSFHVKEDENKSPVIKRDRTPLEKAQAYLADCEYDACGNELRKEVESILGKHLQGLNAAAESGKIEALSNKLNHALKKISETSRKDFGKLFVKKELSLELVRKLQTNFADDPSLDANEKGRLTGLHRELIAYLIKQYELKDNKARLIEETQDILKRIMNPASHAALVPLYELELKNAIAGVQKLKEHLDRT